MLKALTKKEFQERFPNISTYCAINDSMAVYLDNGEILLYSEWNGECYIVKEKDKNVYYTPVYKCIDEKFEEYELIGYKKDF